MPKALRVVRPTSPDVALSWAVRYLMTKPAFADLWFGEWAQVLVGQINRNHYAFFVDATDRVQGFMGWAVTTEAFAEAWVAGASPLSYDDSLAGDCLIFNVWAAESLPVNRFMLDEARKLGRNKKTAYFKRRYPNGLMRPVRLSINEFVAGHIERQSGADTGSPPAPPRN